MIYHRLLGIIPLSLPIHSSSVILYTHSSNVTLREKGACNMHLTSCPLSYSTNSMHWLANLTNKHMPLHQLHDDLRIALMLANKLHADKRFTHASLPSQVLTGVKMQTWTCAIAKSCPGLWQRRKDWSHKCVCFALFWLQENLAPSTQ